MQEQKLKNVMETGGNPSDRRLQFALDVRNGLCRSRKSLPCVYFYDRTGSLLFERICQQPEYYCTRAESEILKHYSEDIAAICRGTSRIVELGNGSSVKTRFILDTFINSETQATYFPIDISSGMLTESAAELKKAYPPLEVQPICARYEDGLTMLDPLDGTTLLIWLGSSIGNFERESAVEFLSQASRLFSTGGRLLLGIDLIKDSEVLEAAYNDRAGVTAAFNLNLLKRINRELGGDFHLDRFKHHAFFNRLEGRIEMHLESCCEQDIQIDTLNLTVSISKGEFIHTENSYKYSVDEIQTLGESAGLQLCGQWFDSEKRFSLNLFEPNPTLTIRGVRFS